MIFMLGAFLTFSAVVFLLLTIFARKYSLLKRVIISFVVFITLSLSFTLFLIVVGDRPSPDAKRIYLEDIDENTGMYKKKE